MTMKIQDYKEIVATPQAHLEFLQHVTGLMDGIDEADAATAARKLHTALRDTVEVGGSPFSQARHLLALEKASGDLWEPEETSPAVLKDVIELSERIRDFDSGYDVPHLTVGHEWMKELAGGAEIAPSR